MPTKHDAVVRVSFDWLRSERNACLFARALAVDPEKIGWFPTVFSGTAFKEDFGQKLNARIIDATARGELAHVIFPDICEAHQIAGLLARLCACSRWYCIPYIRESLDTSLVLLSLRWVLPGNRHAAWVLGMSPVPTMPKTRQSPHTTMILRIRGPGNIIGIIRDVPNEAQNRIRNARGHMNVNLADVPFQITDRNTLRRTVAKVYARKESLGAGDNLASTADPRITFVLPKKGATRSTLWIRAGDFLR